MGDQRFTQFPLPLFAKDLPLPEGWESKIDSRNGKIYFVDFNTKSTTYQDPREKPLPVGWEMRWDARKDKPFFANHADRSTTYSDPRFPVYEAPPQYPEPEIVHTPPSSPMVQQNVNLVSVRNEPNTIRIPEKNITVNGIKLSSKEIEIMRNAGNPCIDGDYWYDARCGAMGFLGNYNDFNL